MKDKIRLIGVDLDGTLLNDNKTLCDGAEKTLSRAAAAGIHIVPITGRPLLGIPECVKKLSCIEYYITSNGAQITSAKSGEAVFSFVIDNEKSRSIISLLRSFNCKFEPFTDGVGYAEPDVYDYYKEVFSGSPLADYIFTSRRVAENIETLFENGEKTADEFFVNCNSENERKKIIDGIENLGGLQVCTLGDRFAEITKKGTDKGSALKRICDHLGVDLCQTIAFGDGENDLEFLETAGIAVAMGNAFPKVKEKADIIADTNNNNGVCKILEEFI